MPLQFDRLILRESAYRLKLIISLMFRSKKKKIKKERKKEKKEIERKKKTKTCFVSIDVTIIRVQVVKINEAPASCEYILHFKRYWYQKKIKKKINKLTTNRNTIVVHTSLSLSYFFFCFPFFSFSTLSTTFEIQFVSNKVLAKSCRRKGRRSLRDFDRLDSRLEKWMAARKK